LATTVVMPKQGQTVESCIITQWHVQVGDNVGKGDVLFEYETDKSAFSEEAKTEGTVLAIYAKEGDDVPCFDTVAVIGRQGEDIGTLAPAAVEKEARQDAVAPVTEAPSATTDTAVEDADRIKVSPRAKTAARQRGLDYRQACPTGPYGRIIERDIAELSRRAPAPVVQVDTIPANTPSAYTDRPLSGIRKSIARAMHTSLSTMAQLTHTTSFDATAILAYRKGIKESAGNLDLANITLNDIVVYGVSRILVQHPELNAHLIGDTLRIFNDVHLGVAVDTPRGLLVPTVTKANLRSLNNISAEVKTLAEQALSEHISPDALTGGTFTVTNLGGLGIEQFTPIINPPQVAILGVCNVTHRIREDGTSYPAMGLCLTYDHRAIDGAPASRFLRDLCFALENFSALLAK